MNDLSFRKLEGKEFEEEFSVAKRRYPEEAIILIQKSNCGRYIVLSNELGMFNVITPNSESKWYHPFLPSKFGTIKGKYLILKDWRGAISVCYGKNISEWFFCTKEHNILLIEEFLSVECGLELVRFFSETEKTPWMRLDAENPYEVVSGKILLYYSKGSFAPVDFRNHFKVFSKNRSSHWINNEYLSETKRAISHEESRKDYPEKMKVDYISKKENGELLTKESFIAILHSKSKLRFELTITKEGGASSRIKDLDRGIKRYLFADGLICEMAKVGFIFFESELYLKFLTKASTIILIPVIGNTVRVSEVE